jgi:hypothetical protein
VAAVSDLEPLDYRLIQQLQARVAQQINVEAQRREANGERELSRDDEQQMAISLISNAVGDHMQQRLLGGGMCRSTAATTIAWLPACTRRCSARANCRNCSAAASAEPPR